MAWLDRVVVRRRRFILSVAAVLAVVSAFLVPFVRFDQDVINMSDPDSESVRTLRELLDDPNTAIRAVSMVEPDSARADTVVARLKELYIVRGTLTLNTFVPGDQDTKLATIRGLAADLGPHPGRLNDTSTVSLTGNPEHERRVAAVEELRWTTLDLCRGQDSATVAAARQLLFLMVMWKSELRKAPENTQVSMVARLEESLVGTLPAVQARLRRALTADPVTRASLPGSLRERWVAADGRERVQVLPADRLDTPEQVRDFVEAVQAEEPAITGMPVENVELGKVTVRAFRLAFGFALLATAATLMLLLGDPRSSAIVMVALLLATLLTGAAAVVFDISFNISNVITLPLLLGLGVDAGIHIVHRRRQRARDGQLLDTATGRAILYSALTTIAGFGNLTLASHRAISGMGGLLVLGMISVMICTLIVLPAIMARPRGALSTTAPSP